MHEGVWFQKKFSDIIRAMRTWTVFHNIAFVYMRR